MTAISRKPNRRAPSLPYVSADLKGHTDLLTTIRNTLEIGQRRTADFKNSFVSVQDLIDLGIIDEDGNFVLEVSGGDGTVESVVAGTGIDVDDTDPANPIVSAESTGGGTVDSVVAGSGIDVDSTDPANPVVRVEAAITNAKLLTEDDQTAPFPNSRRVVAGTNISFDDSVANVRTVSASLSGSDVFAVQSSDLNVTSNIVFQDTSVTLALTAGVWLVTFDIGTVCNATPDMETRLTYTGTVTSVAGVYNRFRGTTIGNVAQITSLPYDQSETTTDSQFRRGSMRLTVSDSGDLKWQIRQQSSSATAVTFMGGSSMRAVKIS